MSVSIKPNPRMPDSSVEIGNEASIVSGTIVILAEHIVRSGKNYKLTGVYGTSNGDANFYLYQNSSTIDEFRTNAAERNYSKSFTSPLIFTSGTIVSLRIAHNEILSQIATGMLMGFEE